MEPTPETAADANDPPLRRRLSTMERRDGMSFTDFEAHWSGPHVAIVARLPGMILYVQHHLVGERPSGADGISEVVFAAPSEMPGDQHFSGEQERDELSFVSAVTAMPMVDPSYDMAPHRVWVLASDGDGLIRSGREPLTGHVAFASSTGVRVDVRDETQPVMSRASLRTDAHPPRVLASAGFDSLDEARSSRELLRRWARTFPDPSVRLAVSTSVRMV